MKHCSDCGNEIKKEVKYKFIDHGNIYELCKDCGERIIRSFKGGTK